MEGELERGERFGHSFNLHLLRRCTQPQQPRQLLTIPTPPPHFLHKLLQQDFLLPENRIFQRICRQFRLLRITAIDVVHGKDFLEELVYWVFGARLCGLASEDRAMGNHEGGSPIKAQDA